MRTRLKLYILISTTTFASVAFAYVDPGSTLFIIQGILALFGGLCVFIKNPIKTIKGAMKKRADAKKNPNKKQKGNKRA